MIVKDIAIKDIELGENIRQKYKNEELNSLMQTIKDNGLLQPIGVIMKNEHSYKILWGNRRLSACKKLGWKSIPAAIYSNDDEMTEQEFIIINGIENLQQSPNTLFEIGRIVKILSKTMSNSEIAVRLGIPQARVKNALTEISRIPAKWQKKIKLMDNRVEPKKGQIPITLAAKVSGMKGLRHETKDKLFEYMSKNDVTLPRLELVSTLVQQGTDIKKAISQTDKYTDMSVTVHCNKVELDNMLTKDYKSKIDLVVDALNKLNPKLNAIKSIRG